MHFDQFSFPWGDLRIDGIIGNQVKISRTLSGNGVDRDFRLDADSTTLMADGADATRVVMRITDEFGAVRPYANDPIVLFVEGPGKLIGESIFSLTGGVGAFWIKADTTPGEVTIRATHQRLGTKTVKLQVQAPPAGWA